MLLLSVGLIVITIGAVVIAIGASLAQSRPFDARAVFLRVAAGAGALSVGASAMYIVGAQDLEAVFANTAADTALVLSAGLLCVALAASAGRERRARATAISVCLTGLVVATGSELLAAETARTVLLFAMAALCGVSAISAWRVDTLPARPLRLIAVAMAFYCLHCAARGIALALFGPASASPSSVFGFTASVVAALGTYIAVAVAIIMLLVPSARTARRRALHISTVTVGDWTLVSEAYGLLRVRQLVEELQTATREIDPFSLDVPRGVATAASAPIASLTAPLTSVYGWRADEIASLLVEEQEHVPRASPRPLSPSA